jgi:hypothetical protein
MPHNQQKLANFHLKTSIGQRLMKVSLKPMKNVFYVSVIPVVMAATTLRTSHAGTPPRPIPAHAWPAYRHDVPNAAGPGHFVMNQTSLR